MPRTAVRKQTVATPAKPAPAPACSNNAAAANVAAPTPAVTAAAPKHEDPHTSTTQRAPATFDQTPQLSSSMPAAVRAANATKESGSPIASPDGDAGESRGRGRSSASGRPSKCHLYLLGKCKRGDCTLYHPSSNELAPCRKFFEGTCNNSRCPRPHITNWGNPYKKSESSSSDEEEDLPSQNAEPVVRENRLGRCSQRICEAYLAGKCRRKNCRFYHPPEGDLKPCRNFFEGRCNNPDCPRPHITNWGNPYKETETSSSDDEDPPPEPPAQTRASESSVVGNGSAQPCQTRTPQTTKEVCRLFRRGLCRWGESCHRLHAQGNSSELRSQNTEPKNDLQEAQPNVDSAPMVNVTGPATNSLPQDTREICRDNLRKKCRRRRCPYRHEAVTRKPDSSANVVADGFKVQGSTGAYEAVPPESTVVIPDPTEKGRRHRDRGSGKELCKKFLLHGWCSSGDSCSLVHPSRNVLAQYLPAADDTCPLYLAGQCRDGDKCKHRHPASSSSKSSGPSPAQMTSGIPVNKAAASLPTAAPLAHRNGRTTTSSVPKDENSKSHNGLQNVAPTVSSKSAGKQPQRLPLSSKPNPTPRRPVSPSSTCAETSSSVSDKDGNTNTHNFRPQSARIAPPLTADTSMSSISSEPLQPPTPRHTHKPAPLMGDMARKIREPPAVPISPLEQLRRVFNVEAKESDFNVQPKSPIPLFPPGLGVEQRHGVILGAEAPGQHVPETVTINVLDAVTVTFGPGLQVNSLKTGFESTLVILMHIPAKTKTETMIQLLSKYGEVQHVEMSDAKSNDIVTVKATFATNAEAVRACAALDNNKAIFGTRISAKHASSKSTALGKGFVQDGTVRIEFPAPQKAAYASYETMEQAEAAIQKARSTYEYDCMLDAVVWNGVPSLGGITVKFKGLPPDAKLDFVNQFGKNKGTMLERPNYTASIESTGRLLLKNLENFGEIEKVTFLAPPYERQQVVAWARFKSPSGAANACAGLSGRTPQWLGRGLLVLKHVLNVQYALPIDAWNSIRDDVINIHESFRMDPAPGWVQWRVPTNGKSAVQVKLCASQLPVLSKLKIAFDAVLRGERVTEDGHWVWDPFFSRKAGATFIDIIQSNYRNLLINVDKNKRYISLFGPRRERAVARERILGKIRNLHDQVFHTFPLDSGLVGLFVNADLMKLQEELGHENVVIDLAEQLLKVRGNQDAVKVTRLILQDAKRRHVTQRRPTRSSCPVCFDEASLPVTLSCGHTWCKTCLTDYILASVDTHTFPLKCLGDEGRCGVPIPVVVARDLLSSEQFASVTRASYLSYIHSRASEFFYCPTPDCPQVYRSTTTGSILQCPSCLVRICARCHVESHDGTACVDREREDRRLFEQWSRTHDVKQCPGCKTAIERIAGCNHITCVHCKTHICWQCLQTFKESGEVYEHMRSVHGGIGVEEFWF